MEGPADSGYTVLATPFGSAGGFDLKWSKEHICSSEQLYAVIIFCAGSGFETRSPIGFYLYVCIVSGHTTQFEFANQYYLI